MASGNFGYVYEMSGNRVVGVVATNVTITDVLDSPDDSSTVLGDTLERDRFVVTGGGSNIAPNWLFGFTRNAEFNGEDIGFKGRFGGTTYLFTNTPPETLVEGTRVRNLDGTEPICFLAGTRIMTPRGEVAVEDLRAGDTVTLAEGRTLPVRWIGRQTIARRFSDPLRDHPVRIAAGALGPASPSRDLRISPGHALLVDGVLVNAGALVNGTTVTRVHDLPDSFVYYHVELPEHAILVADGAPAESFVDNADRGRFDNWTERDAAMAAPTGELALPRIVSARQVPAAMAARIAGARAA